MALAQWKDLCIDANDASVLGSFWGRVLGMTIEHLDDGDVRLGGERPQDTIWINTVPERRSAKHRVHLDLNAASIDPVVEIGATVLLPASESGFPWTVMADPEGGEFCVFLRADHPEEPPATRYELVVDTVDAESAHAQAAWWRDVLGGEVVDDDRGFSWLAQVPDLPFDTIDFIPVPEGKVVKNRIHWDISCDDLPALLERGATIIAKPTDEIRWHVCADPEGNEFCVFEPV